MERQPPTPRESAGRAKDGPEDPFSVEWKRATELTQQQHREEGTDACLPPYLRSHQRNYSSGNIDELRDKPNRKLSPLVIDSSIIDTQPLRTVIYPESHSPAIATATSADPEQMKLLTLDHKHDDPDVDSAP